MIQMNTNPKHALSVLGDQPYPAYELRNMVRYLDQQQQGDELLRHIGFDRKILKEEYFPTYKVLEAFRYCSQALGPLAAAKMGASYQVSDLGVFGYAIASSQNLRHTLELEEKYQSLLGNILKRESVIQGKHLVSKMYNVQSLDAETLHFFTALSNSARLHVARSIFGDDLNYASISFTFNDEKNRQAYEDLFGCEVEFDAQHNGWSLDTRQFQRKIKDGNHADFTQYLPYCNELLENLKQKHSMVNEIQQILVSCAGDYPDIEMLAGAFKISSRTLRRQLANIGTSYQKILNKVRCQLSIEYLSRTDISIEDISNLIGFSDVTNFRHAFKKWVGKTPSFYRKTYQS